VGRKRSDPHVQRFREHAGKQLAERQEGGRKKAHGPSTLNSVETYRKPRRSLSLAKITWGRKAGRRPEEGRKKAHRPSTLNYV
jgi:hypothetical protein